MEQKIAFIGGGNMAEGLIQSMVKHAQYNPKQIYVYELIHKKLNALAEKYKINPCESVKDAVTEANIVILAVRPQDAENVSYKIKPYLSQSSIFVSICAGITINKIRLWLEKSQKVMRVMPNTLIGTSHGFSAICISENSLNDDVKQVRNIFQKIGPVMEIPENMFDVFTAYSCANPAFLLYIVNAFIDAGVRAGFSRDTSRSIIIENMIGTAIQLKENDNHPFEMIDTMTSPAGVSIEGLYSMSKEGIYGSIMSSIYEAIKQSERLS